MGTRAITKIKDEQGKTIIHIYRQFDGYEKGHGQDLKDFLENIKLVNGLSSNKKNVANGMGCLAAQLVAHLKEEAGGFYLVNFENDSESYNYTIYPENMNGSYKIGEIFIKVESYDRVLYDGKVSDYKPMKEIE